MALPATSSPSPPLPAHADWLAEHTQHTHRNTSAAQKRRHDDLDDTDTRTSIASGLKRLRINPHSPLPQRPINGLHPRYNDQQYASNNVLPNSSAFPTSHPAYLAPQHLTPQPSPLHLTPGKGSLSHYLSPHPSLHDRNYTNTPPPQSLASASSSRTSTWNINDAMTLDNPNLDTPNRIVINDLDAELAEIEAEEEQKRQRDQEQAFFLPDDIEKQMKAIPEDVLRNNGAPERTLATQALILYKEPSSITMLEEEDTVKKAVREARQRLREKQQAEPVPGNHVHQMAQRPQHPPVQWPGFEPIMDEDVNDLEQQRRYQESAAPDWHDDEDAMDIE